MLYCSLPIICPTTTFSLKWEGGLYSNVRLVSTIRLHMNVAKSHDDLAISIGRNSSNIGLVAQKFSQVCWYFLQKSGNKITCIVSGDRKQMDTGWFGSVSTPSGEKIILIAPFAKQMAYFKSVLQKIHGLLYTTIYSVHVLIEIF